MQPMCHGVMGIPFFFFLVGGWGLQGVCFQVVFGVESGLFTFHLDRVLSMQDFIFYFLFFWEGSWRGQSNKFPSF
jgi:hypothetical protein